MRLSFCWGLLLVACGGSEASVDGGVSKDAGSDVTVDATTDASGVCFDATGKLDSTLRACTVASDCATLQFQLDCCGNSQLGGISKSAESIAQTCTSERDAKFPKCGCPTGPLRADDGSTNLDGGMPTVTCDEGVCTTRF